MKPLKEARAPRGRKFELAVLGMLLGLVVTLVSLVLAALHPESAVSIASIAGQFALVLSVSLSAFSGANAIVEWRHGGAGGESTMTQRVEVREETHTPSPG